MQITSLASVVATVADDDAVDDDDEGNGVALTKHTTAIDWLIEQ